MAIHMGFTDVLKLRLIHRVWQYRAERTLFDVQDV
jgi:hypothetical protein